MLAEFAVKKKVKAKLNHKYFQVRFSDLTLFENVAHIFHVFFSLDAISFSVLRLVISGYSIKWNF